MAKGLDELSVERTDDKNLGQVDKMSGAELAMLATDYISTESTRKAAEVRARAVFTGISQRLTNTLGSLGLLDVFDMRNVEVREEGVRMSIDFNRVGYPPSGLLEALSRCGFEVGSGGSIVCVAISYESLAALNEGGRGGVVSFLRDQVTEAAKLSVMNYGDLPGSC